MKKHTLNCLLLMVISLGVCSCSTTLERFGRTEQIYFKEIVIKDDVQYEVQKPWLAIVRDGKESCFDDVKEGTITVRASQLRIALDYFFGSKATWNITRVQKKNENIIRTVANSEMQIKYEVAYCNIKVIKMFRNDEDVYASFRLINPTTAGAK